MTEELCPALIRKNIVLAETGGELTVPLARLNANCEFKKRWDEIQNKWYGVPAEIKAYKQKPEFKAYYKAYRQKPEVKAYYKAYYKAYRQKPEVKAKIKAQQKAYYQKMKLLKQNEN